MYKIEGSLPTPSSSIQEIADFIECQSIRSTSISISDAVKPILLAGDEIDIDGIEDEDDRFINTLESVVEEIERRARTCNHRYPFELTNKGYTISAITDDYNYWVYAYLLLSTRLNMTNRKTLENIDGTQLLEKLSAAIAKSYFGDRSEAIVFGTAMPGNFDDKVTALCNQLGEGLHFDNKNNSQPNAQDDKLDVVVWKSFADTNPSKMIGFGQCKTGTTWDDRNLTELQPAVFCQKWFRYMPVVIPLRMFFSSQYFPSNEWYSRASNAGIVFDRFRMLDFLPDTIDNDLLNQIKTWSEKGIEILRAN